MFPQSLATDYLLDNIFPAEMKLRILHGSYLQFTLVEE